MVPLVASASTRGCNASTTRCASYPGTVHARVLHRLVGCGALAAPSGLSIAPVAMLRYILVSEALIEPRVRGAVVAQRIRLADMTSNLRVNPPHSAVTALAEQGPRRRARAGYAHR